MQPDPALTRATFAYVMETAPVLALRLDADQRVIAANAQARRVLGQQVVGRTLAELVVDFTAVPTDPGERVHLLSLQTAAGIPESFHFRRFALPDGTLALGSLDLPEQERLQTEVLGLNRELNDLTRQLHLANAELRDLNQLKNQFLGMAAHDLRIPVGAIMNCTGFVLDEAGDTLSSGHRSLLETALDSAHRMERLIDGFLDVSIIDSGGLRLELEPATAAEILAGVQPIAQLMGGKKKLLLQVGAADDARRLLVDGPKLQQVLLNLVGNAIEHSAPGQQVWLSSHWDDQDLVFEVRDEGPGIAPADRARMFMAFARTGTRKTAGERHAGLGLAIAQMIVEAHGGRIGVESIPGHGTTFRVALPAQSDHTDPDPTDP